MRDLAIQVDDRHGRRVGLERAIRHAIRAGRLTAGSPLPSTRSLATDLGYSRATIVAAYEQLTAEGYLTSRQGAGTVVAEVHAPPPDQQATASAPAAYLADFRPGEPSAAAFPRSKWKRSINRVLASTPDHALGYPDPRGTIELRTALAEYLARSRAVVVTPAAVSVFAGFSAAIGFLADAFARMGVRTVAIENPSLFIVRDILALSGVDVVPVPLDGQGIDVAALAATKAQVVIVTPGHQYPTGVIMTSQRRTELIDWAHRNHGWIVEDDYDGEFRYDRQPLGALQGLSSERVIYAGTASKSLLPGLRIGWLVVPAELRRSLAGAKHFRGSTSTLEQLTLADFVQSGELDRHLRSVRAMYRSRMETLLDRLSEILPGRTIVDEAAGLHLLLQLPDRNTENELVRKAEEARIGLLALGPHWTGQPTASGLVLGCSRPAEHEFRQALDHLIEFLASMPWVDL